MTKPGEGEEKCPREVKGISRSQTVSILEAKVKSSSLIPISVENYQRPISKAVTQFDLGFKEIIRAAV